VGDPHLALTWASTQRPEPKVIAPSIPDFDEVGLARVLEQWPGGVDCGTPTRDHRP
jgi:hypothetical protein